jgi:pantothenate kinase
MNTSSSVSEFEAQTGALAERARALATSDRRALLGVTGPPGVGKSTFTRALVERLGETARLVGMDGFHLPRAYLDSLGRLTRMGAIDTFDAAGFLALVRRLREPRGEIVYAPEFRRDREESISGAVAIEPSVRLVVVEGNYLLAEQQPWCELAPLFDAVWYCECDEATRIARLIARHCTSGKSEEEARRWALGSDQRNAELVLTTKARADLVVSMDDGPAAQSVSG